MEINGISFNLLDIPAELTEEYNRWYDLDHIAEHISKADVLMGRRYVRPAAYRELDGIQVSDFLDGYPPYLTIYSFGGYSGLIYLAMEFVEGVSLGQIVSESGRLTPDQCLPLLLQICAGMAYAHRHNVMHRDLKPDNVMVLKSASIETASVMIVDFGLSRLLDGTEEQRLTRTGEVVGDTR